MRRDAFIASVACVLATPLAIAPAWSADSSAGKALFRQQCALCHSAEPDDSGGAQGPRLHRVVGRRAGSDRDFGYTDALRRSDITWSAETLDRFLAAPTTVVPGTAMTVAVPSASDRQNLIEYFRAVGAGTFKAAPRELETPRRSQSGSSSTSDADWRRDFPGRRHRIDVAKLPPAYDTPSAVNFPKIIPQPAGAGAKLPPGFRLEVFASGLERPRSMRVAPHGDVFVSESHAGRVRLLRPSTDGARAAMVETFAQGLVRPYGMAFYPVSGEPKWLYVAETNRIVRYEYSMGDQRARSVPQIVVPQLAPAGEGGHATRDLAFSADGKRMFVSVGSQSNVAEEMPKKTPGEVQAWEAEHGLGAAWGSETNRAAVLVFDVHANAPGKVFASGIRNCVGLTIEPLNGDLWCTTNERDGLGDDLVPDYSTRVREGAFYGWPWYYLGDHEDPRLQGERPDLIRKVSVPDVLYQAHSAPLHLVFYAATSGRSAFPTEYVGDGFATLHGSWNSAARTGHKVVRVRMRNGVPTGEYEDFLVGFIAKDGNAWGRPAGLIQLADGSLLVSDDGAGVVYRISYGRPAPQHGQ